MQTVDGKGLLCPQPLILTRKALKKCLPGETLKIETVAGDVGSAIVLDNVLMVGDGDKLSVGKPLLAGASVSATIVSNGRHDKVTIFKMRRRKHYQKHQGHRQNYTEIRIDGISA